MIVVKVIVVCLIVVMLVFTPVAAFYAGCMREDRHLLDMLHKAERDSRRQR